MLINEESVSRNYNYTGLRFVSNNAVSFLARPSSKLLPDSSEIFPGAEKRASFSTNNEDLLPSYCVED